MIPLALLALSFSFLFSGLEMAYLSVDKLWIALQKEQGSWTDRWLNKFVRHPTHFLSMLLIGNTLALTVYVYAMTSLTEETIRSQLKGFWQEDLLVFLSQSLINTLIVLILAEFIPKNLFRFKPNFSLRILIIPTIVFHYLLHIPVQAIVSMARFFLRKFLRLSYEEKKLIFGRPDLGSYFEGLKSSGKENEGLDGRVLSNALNFDKVRVRDCMVPRTEIQAVGREGGENTLKEAV
ncbi:MAG: CNNM domain-containing protein, partial [Cytophagales bacterium]|nr:CNNM domain-containing protein [Cytophagales bacterium]